MISLHKCAVPGCEERILSGFLMCLKHWYRVSGELRYRYVIAKRGTPEHDAAREAAIAEVVAKPEAA